MDACVGPFVEMLFTTTPLYALWPVNPVENGHGTGKIDAKLAAENSASKQHGKFRINTPYLGSIS